MSRQRDEWCHTPMIKSNLSGDCYKIVKPNEPLAESKTIILEIFEI